MGEIKIFLKEDPLLKGIKIKKRKSFSFFFKEDPFLEKIKNEKIGVA